MDLFKSERIDSHSVIKFKQIDVETPAIKSIRGYCNDLKRIDDTWRAASSNFFGFKAQNQVIRNVKFTYSQFNLPRQKIQRQEEFHSQQFKALGWGELKNIDIAQIEEVRKDHTGYVNQRDKILNIIKNNGGYSDLVNLGINLTSEYPLAKYKGHYPITIKLGTTENWPNFDDWCSPDYVENRKNKDAKSN